MDIYAEFSTRIGGVLQSLASEKGITIDIAKLAVEAPRDATHGDLATNAAMVTSKDFGSPPRALAEDIVKALQADGDVIKAEIAGPGFVNWSLSNQFWHKTLAKILQAGTSYGLAPQREPTPENTINVEYVSANPTGPMHVGHGRGAVVGDALASVLQAAGYHVVREYYINDAGAQVDVLARSVYLRYCEALGDAIDIPAGLYPGDYLKEVGATLAKEFGSSLKEKSESEWLPLLRERAVHAMMDMIKGDLAAIGIKHDIFFSEKTLMGANDRVKAAIDELRAKGDIYEGILPKPKGAVDDDWEEREQTLFRATAYGDDVDRPLMKSDGSYTYFASDIAYHFVKYQRGANTLIDVLGADHGGYVKRMTAAVKAITKGEGALDVRITQMVKLLKNGEPFKMSKRAGDFVTLRDVIDEVGKDAIRFMMLMRKADAPLDFDLAKVKEQSKDNPVFYVQYAHARIHSVYKQAKEAFPNLVIGQGANFAGLTDSAELDLIKQLSFYPRLIASAGAAKEPHRIAFYLYDLASALHSLWNKGKDMPQLRFIIVDDEAITHARLALLRAVEVVLASGLGILGVSAPQEMR